MILHHVTVNCIITIYRFSESYTNLDQYLFILLLNKSATDEGSLPEISQYSPCYLPLNVLLLHKDKSFIFFTVSR